MCCNAYANNNFEEESTSRTSPSLSSISTLTFGSTCGHSMDNTSTTRTRMVDHYDKPGKQQYCLVPAPPTLIRQKAARPAGLLPSSAEEYAANKEGPNATDNNNTNNVEEMTQHCRTRL
jgi:hypothetical protein